MLSRIVKTGRVLLSAALLLVAVFFASAEAGRIQTGMFGLWAWGDWDAAYKLVGDNRFDLAVSLANKGNLDKAQRAGVKCLVALGLTKKITEDETKWQNFLHDLKTKVAELKNHPAVFAWYIGDEPDWQDLAPDKLKEACEVVRSVDTAKPIFSTLSNRNEWGAYVPYLDIVAIDPYLTRSRPGVTDRPEVIRDYLKKMKREISKAGGHKSLWLVVGAFEEVPNTPGGVSRYVKPTPAQFNEMVDIGIQEGVAGLLVFTLAKINNPGHLDWNLPKNDPVLWDTVRALPKRIGAYR